jgi:poly-gamma-glutamate capsule biosynthesis protein CapA/YwtB (metallophosphatase superfamily)
MPFELSTMRADVQRAKTAADVVIVSCHIGLEYFSYPLPQHRQALQGLIDVGADLILGHHPHVLQGVERRRNGVIAYSLGNFVFDISESATEAADQPEAMKWLGRPIQGASLDSLARSVILRCELTPKGVTALQLIPVRLSMSGQPTIADKAEAVIIQREIERLSANLDGGTEFDLGALEIARSRSLLWSKVRKRPLIMLRRLYRLRGRHVRLLIKSLRPGGP